MQVPVSLVLIFIGSGVGTLVRFSLVKVLAKKLLSSLAISSSPLISSPVVFLMGPTPTLLAVFLFT